MIDIKLENPDDYVFERAELGDGWWRVTWTPKTMAKSDASGFGLRDDDGMTFEEKMDAIAWRIVREAGVAKQRAAAVPKPTHSTPIRLPTADHDPRLGCARWWP